MERSRLEFHSLLNDFMRKGVSINYHRKVSYVSLITFCHLMDSF